MRRYIVDYTSRHDTSVCAEIMEPDYTLRMGQHVLSGRDELYIPAATKQFAQFPGLCITVHEIVTNGDSLALRFSEHGASKEHNGTLAAWAGIGVYRWNGARLVENFVEQDYLSRRRQLRSGMPERVGSPAIAPWDTLALPPDPSAEDIVTTWARSGMRGGDVRQNDGSPGPLLEGVEATIDDIFSAGSAVAFRVTLRGTYAGGLPELDERHYGTPTALYATGVVHTAHGRVSTGDVVTGRLDLVRMVTTLAA